MNLQAVEGGSSDGHGEGVVVGFSDCLEEAAVEGVDWACS